MVVMCVVFNTSCMKNTFYYKSENGMVLASAKKTLFMSDKNAEFRSLVIGSNNYSVSDNYSALYVKIGNFGVFNMANMTQENILKINGVIIPENPYIPTGLEDGVKFYDIAGVSVIMSSDGKKVLRVSIYCDGKLDLRVGINEKSMTPFPLSTRDLKDLFGPGNVYSVFNHQRFFVV